mmetsp:Transcript_31945/g.75141  ORF Transcript_31945/g.75141 Transcript_31945/m.75141 type:complete len:831 (-) Transcript_31945:70-2562(-)
METMMEKRIRRRMTLITSEKDRARKTRFVEFTSVKSFDEIKEEREAVLGQAGFRADSSDDERDETCDASIMTECVSELRRRRVYEMTHGRPYPLKSSKKKHNFWQPEDPSRSLLLSPSFSEQSNVSALAAPAREAEGAAAKEGEAGVAATFFSQSQLTPEKNVGRILWDVQTTNLQRDLEAIIRDNNTQTTNVQRDLEVVISNKVDERQRIKDSFIKDEVADGFVCEDDEIMTPVRIKKFIDAYDEAKNEEEREGIVLPLFQQTEIVVEEMNRSETETTLTEVSTATQALAAFITSAVGVMKEAKTPEKDENGKYLIHLNQVEPKCLSAATPYKATKLFQEKGMFAAFTPSSKLITTVPTPKTTETIDSSMDDADIMVTKIDSDNDDAVDVTTIVEEMDYGVLWPSLFCKKEPDDKEAFPEVIETDTKKMLEALVEGGALQREVDGTNVLKLFVDMYHKHTFERIVRALQALKGLQSLVICRAIDKNRRTYRTTEEIKCLFDATMPIQKLESLVLLNFSSASMTDLATLLHSQPFLYRLKIQMADGTLDGEVLGMMATAPCLTHASLDLKESCSFATLLNSKTLQTLQVNSKSLDMQHSHVQTLVCSLQSNLILTTLDLTPVISVEHFRMLCHTVKYNYRLESLRVNLRLKTEEESKTVAMELANLFRENNVLINVWNYSHSLCTMRDSSKRDLFAALRNSKSMQEFKFFSEDLGDWKNAEGGNPPWLEENLNSTLDEYSTVMTIDDPKEGELSDSFSSSYIFGDDKSRRGDEPLAMCGLQSSDLQGTLCGIDVSDFSTACDCTALRKIGTKIHDWANETKKKAQYMDMN